MTPLRVAAAATVSLPAGDAPAPLRALVQEVCTQPPRRVSRVIELALLGAHRCLRGTRPEPRCPLYLSLTHGCVADGVALVKQVAEKAQAPAPVAFINVSSNMAGFYVAATLGIHGSNQAVAADDFSFEAALELASLGREHRAQGLIGAVEEVAWPLPEHRVRLGLAPDRALAEASHWLFVDQSVTAPLATVQWVRRYDDAAAARAALAREAFAGAGRLALSHNLLDHRDEWVRTTGLTLLEDEGTHHSGVWSAYRICRFIETRAAPCLLHVSQGRRGCYAVYVTR